MKSIELGDSLEAEFAELVRPSEHLPSKECQEDQVYWADTRRIGSTTICRGETENGLAFEGLREKFGTYFLFSEYHYDDNEYFGTLKPYVELGPAPDISKNRDLMDWFLEQEIEFTEMKLAWLQAMPDKFKGTLAYPAELEDTVKDLARLHKVHREGFEAQVPTSMRAIIETARKAQQDKLAN